MPLTARAVMIAAVACALVAACGDKPEEGTRPSPEAGAAPAKPASTEAQLPAHMVAAVSAGKSSSSIGLHFALQTAPAIGKPLAIDIAIVPHEPFESVHALFEAPEALAMSAGKQFDARKDVKAETVLDHRLQLQPTKEGVYLITAAVETQGESATVTRIYSIPVIVSGGSTTPAPAGAPVPAAAAGE